MFDVVFSVETVEHVLEHELPGFLSEIRRVLKSAGVAVITTPNNEDLATGMNFCPACGAEYHQWQHVRSWSRSTLSSALEHAGFEVEFCADLDFRDFLPPVAVSWTSLTPRLAASRVLRRLVGILDRLERRRFPHLRSIARRVGSGTAPHLVAIARKTPETPDARP
jgi:SAM-dependent methyltransferase